MKKSKAAILITTILIVIILTTVIAEAVISKRDIPILGLLFPDSITMAEAPPEPGQSPSPTPAPTPVGELNIIKMTPTPSPTPTPAPTPTPVPEGSSAAPATSEESSHRTYGEEYSSRPVVTEPDPDPPYEEPTPTAAPEPEPPAVTAITLDNTYLELSVGDVWQLNILSAPDEAWDYGITCSISNSNIIDTVSYGGSSITIQANAMGTATLTVYGGGYSATCTVSVS